MGLKTYTFQGADRTANAGALANDLLAYVGAGRLYSLHVLNTGPAQYVLLCDESAVPDPITVIPKEAFWVAAGAALEVEFEHGRPFTNGIYVCNSDTYLNNPALDDCLIDITFARS